MADQKPDTVFQKMYDAIDQWQPSPDVKDALSGGMKEVFKKLIEILLSILQKEFGEKK